MTDEFITTMDYTALEQAMELFPTAFSNAAQAFDSYPIQARRPPAYTAEEQIEFVMAGIRLLDERHPDWRDSIDWRILDMGATQHCIMGQLYQGDYAQGLYDLGITCGAWKYGFETYDHSYTQLTRLWKKLAHQPPSTDEEPIEIHWIPPSYRVMERTARYYNRFPIVHNIPIPIKDG